MNALFGEDLERTNALFARTQHRHAIGAFEDANYEASGYYRPAMQCIMFDCSEKFCPACQDGISEITDLYAWPAASKEGGTSTESFGWHIRFGG